MTDYARLYRFGLRPWERYARTAAPHVAAMIADATAERAASPGRAVDLGCGRGLLTPLLARQGWDAVGVDLVPRAVEAARRRGDAGVTYTVADVTDLLAARLGTFDLFLDVGCFQGLDADRRAATGRAVTASARDGATLLLLAFGPSRWERLVEGVPRSAVAAAFPAWDLLEERPATTAGLGWPMNRTSPRWYRLRLRQPAPGPVRTVPDPPGRTPGR